MNLIRKDVSELSLPGSAVLVLVPNARPGSGRGRTSVSWNPLSKPFRAPLRIPPVSKPLERTRITDYYRLTVRSAGSSATTALRPDQRLRCPARQRFIAPLMGKRPNRSREGALILRGGEPHQAAEMKVDR